MNIDLSGVAEGGNGSSEGRARMKILESYYEMSDGYGEHPMPQIFLSGVTNSGRTVLRVVGFRSFFFVSYSEFVERRGDIESEMEKRNPTILDYQQGYTLMGEDALEGDVEGVKLWCVDPDMVGGDDGLVNEFDRTWEADIGFCQRFLTSMGINDYCRIPQQLAGTECQRDVRPTEIEVIEE